MKFDKQPLSFADQLSKLKSRGMIIADESAALSWLKSVSYYRASAYFHSLKDANGSYAAGSDFQTVRMLYSFDRKLRLLLLDAIERIEVALRTSVTHQIAMNYGPFGHCDPKNFSERFDHRRFMEDLSKAEVESTETFVAHFRGKYRAEPYLPIWMASELMSFGAVSRIYKALHPELRRKIAGGLHTTDYFLQSWAHSLSYVRNLSAHHCRVWNRTLAIKPKLPERERWWPYVLNDNHGIYCVLIIAHHLVLAIAPGATWTARVQELFDEYPSLPISALGVPPNWRTVAPWSAFGEVAQTADLQANPATAPEII